MALPAVSPRSAAGAQPAFALTRAQGSWTLWAGRREGGRGVSGVGRGAPQEAGADPRAALALALGPALGSGRDVHARGYGGCVDGDLTSIAPERAACSHGHRGRRRPRSSSARGQDCRRAACLGRASPPSHGVWVPESQCRGSWEGRLQGMGFPFPLFNATLLGSQVVLFVGL